MQATSSRLWRGCGGGAAVAAVLPAVIAGTALAAGGPFGIDHPIALDDRGAWSRHNQQALEVGTVAVVLGGALWEGDQTRLGRVYWQSVDALVLGAASSELLKLAFSRSRPSQSSDPNDWFQGHGHKSFPSGEVTAIAGAVTPFVLEYGARDPAVYAFELLPLYDAVARVKSHAHWQSDVLAGYALGTALGYYAHARPSSLVIGVLPGGFSVGWRTRF